MDDDDTCTLLDEEIGRHFHVEEEMREDHEREKDVHQGSGRGMYEQQPVLAVQGGTTLQQTHVR